MEQMEQTWNKIFSKCSTSIARYKAFKTCPEQMEQNFWVKKMKNKNNAVSTQKKPRTGAVNENADFTNMDKHHLLLYRGMEIQFSAKPVFRTWADKEI